MAHTDAGQSEAAMQQAVTKLAVGALIMSSLLFGAPAQAQNYPTKPIRFIVPFPPGGIADVVARVMGQKLGEALGQSAVIENRAGASGTLGAGEAAKAAPDGYTLLLTTGDFTTTPTMVPTMSFDPRKDLIPITMIATSPLALVAKADGPFASVKDLIAAAKQSPGKVAFSSPGNGTINHLAGEWLGIEGGFKLLHVPYRGGVPAATGVVTGDVPIGVLSPSSVQPYVEAGKMKGLALLTQKRPLFAADWPIISDSGLAIEAALWVGLFAPAGTASAIVNRLDTEVTRILQQQDFRKRLNDLGTDPSPLSQAAFVERISSDAERYAKIIAQAGIQIQH